MRSTFHVRITCGCRGLSILFDQSKIPASVRLASIDEIIDDSSSSIEVALRDQNLYRTRAARRDVRCNHADKLILKQSSDTFALQQALQKIGLYDVSGVNDVIVFIRHLLTVLKK